MLVHAGNVWKTLRVLHLPSIATPTPTNAGSHRELRWSVRLESMSRRLPACLLACLHLRSLLFCRTRLGALSCTIKATLTPTSSSLLPLA